ncbi:MAG: GNAT family N-acetyltransferase [Candidatus Binatia bacterium]
MMQIRPELSADHERVFAIHETAFERSNEATLVSLLRSCTSPQLSLVAEVDGRVVGHVFFSPVFIDSSTGAPPAAGLAPLAVDPEFQGCGVGSALVRAGLRRCPELGWQAAFLVGDPAYYSRFGFVLAATLGLHYRNEAFDPVFQVVEFMTGALRACQGRVRFHDAFARSGTE